METTRNEANTGHMTGFDVTFLPDGKTVRFEEAIPLSDAAAAAEVLVEHPCGSKATCGKCRVRFATGAPDPTRAELELLSPDAIETGWRLSCQSVVDRDAQVEVPLVSRSASAKGFGGDDLFQDGFEPAVRRRVVRLPEPGLEYQWALEDSLHLQLGIGCNPRPTLAQLLSIGACAETAGGELTLVIDGSNLAGVKPGNATGTPLLGYAVDLGSTSLAGAIVNLETGAVVASNSVLNPQVSFGADVISRIFYAQSRDDGNARLHDAIVGAVNRLMESLLAEAGATTTDVYSVCAVGNPAMLHTFVGADVRPLGQAPYVGLWTRGMSIPAVDMGVELPPGVHVRILPTIRSNVGADTVSAIIATGLDLTDKMTLMIDLGTNSEIVLGNRARMMATSTAAGPAFEGANIRQGMRAAPGAIDRVSLRPGGKLAVHVLGGMKAKGVCGSALIDAAAVLLRSGLLDASGRLHSREALNSRKYPDLAPRIVHGEHGHPAVILATPGESENGVPVMLNALDVRQLQLIKGSIHAGAHLLMRAMGVGYDDIEQVLIAGAFGSFVRKASAIDIGLVPPVDPERVFFIGNAAGVGARIALVDHGAWKRAEMVRERAEYVELGGHPEYQDAFCEAMGFHDSPALADAER